MSFPGAFLVSTTPGGNGGEMLVISLPANQPQPNTKGLRLYSRRLAKPLGVSSKAFILRGQPHPELDDMLPQLTLDLSEVEHLSAALAKRKAEEVTAECGEHVLAMTPAPSRKKGKKAPTTHRISLHRANLARYH